VLGESVQGGVLDSLAAVGVRVPPLKGWTSTAGYLLCAESGRVDAHVLEELARRGAAAL
jgi:hypothetical protein